MSDAGDRYAPTIRIRHAPLFPLLGYSASSNHPTGHVGERGAVLPARHPTSITRPIPKPDRLLTEPPLACYLVPATTSGPSPPPPSPSSVARTPATKNPAPKTVGPPRAATAAPPPSTSPRPSRTRLSPRPWPTTTASAVTAPSYPSPPTRWPARPLPPPPPLRPSPCLSPRQRRPLTRRA